jgi:hypothetical protein
VLIVKFALVAPAKTVTWDGTVALVEVEDRATDIPPVGAALLIVAVPVDEAPL